MAETYCTTTLLFSGHHYLGMFCYYAAQSETDAHRGQAGCQLICPDVMKTLNPYKHLLLLS